jgi:orotate phosphoribosyltransferase
LQFSQRNFNNFIINEQVLGFFNKPITLKSGRISNWYVNWRTVSEDVFLIDKLSDFVLAFVKQENIKFDCFYGVPEGASKLSIISQFKLAKKAPNFAKGSHVLAMGRGKEKTHGVPKDRFFVGMPQGNVVVMEDVVTTGTSLLNTIDKLREANISVVAAIGLTDRMELRDDGKTVKEAVEEKGVKYYGLSKATELLPEIVKIKPPSAKIITSIEKEFQRFGVEKIKLK